LKIYNKTASEDVFYCAKITSIQYSDMTNLYYLVGLDTNLTSGVLSETDIVEVFIDLDTSGSGGVESVTGASVDNTDPLNPVVNAIPLSGTEVGSPVTGDIESNAGLKVETFTSSIESVGLIQTFKSGIDAYNIAIGDVDAIYGSGTAISYSTLDPDIFNVGGQLIYAIDFSSLYTDRSLVDKEYVVDTKHTGISLYNATTTGTVNLDCATFDSWYRILTGNTDFTFSNTPASGETFVKTLEIITTAGETLDFSTADVVIGTFVNDDTTVNIITINFANYPTVGLRVTVMINS
jgi:hypothetical protein